MDQPLHIHMDNAEFSQMHAALLALQPRIGLEWGAGGSTEAFLMHIPTLERLVSIEHSPKWHALLKGRIKDPRLSLHLVEGREQEPPPPLIYTKYCARDKWRKACENDRRIMEKYIDFPKTLDLLFDFILIDGRARSFCIETGWPLLRPGGLMVVHDAQRPAYHAAMHKVGTPHFLTPWRRGQIALMPKPASMKL